MSKPRYSSPLHGSPRRFPKPQKPLLDRVIDEMKRDIDHTHCPVWHEAATKARAHLMRYRRKLRKNERTA